MLSVSMLQINSCLVFYYIHVDLGCSKMQEDKINGGPSVTCRCLGLEFISFVFWWTG